MQRRNKQPKLPQDKNPELPLEYAPVIHLELVVHESGDYYGPVLDRLPVAVLNGGLDKIVTLGGGVGGAHVVIAAPGTEVCLPNLERQRPSLTPHRGRSTNTKAE